MGRWHTKSFKEVKMTKSPDAIPTRRAQRCRRQQVSKSLKCAARIAYKRFVLKDWHIRAEDDIDCRLQREKLLTNDVDRGMVDYVFNFR